MEQCGRQVDVDMHDALIDVLTAKVHALETILFTNNPDLLDSYETEFHAECDRILRSRG